MLVNRSQATAALDKQWAAVKTLFASAVRFK